jgi:hemoglobin
MDIFEMREKLSEGQISALVHAFYAEVRQDPDLAPIFDARIEDGAWPEHLARMCDFWSTILLGTARYRRDPMAAHVPLTEVEPRHFSRWLELFSRTAHRLAEAETAAAIALRAGRMAERLRGAMRI